MAKKQVDYTLEDWRDYYDRLYRRSYDNYQQSGDPRHEREYHRYQMIAEAFGGYIEYRKEEDDARTRRFHNVEAFIKNNVLEETYMKDEVIRMLRKVGSF